MHIDVLSTDVVVCGIVAGVVVAKFLWMKIVFEIRITDKVSNCKGNVKFQ